MERQTVILLGPCLEALSGVSTHVKSLLESRLTAAFELVHFEVGSEGRDERPLERAGRLLWSPVRLLLVLRRRRAAIVHVNSALTPRAFWRDLAFMLVARLVGARIVYQVHGGPLPDAFCGHRLLARSFVRWTLLLPHLIVVLSAKERVAFDRFVGTTPVVAIAHGVDGGRDHAEAGDGVRKTGPLRLLFLGRLVREKGVFELIAGMETAAKNGVPVELTVAGEGADEAKIRARSKRSAVPVAFVGPLRGPAKLAMLRASDVFVLPSYAEGLPYALLEAMAAGTAVLASRVGAIPEIIDNGVNGLLVEPRDARAIALAIERLATDTELLMRMRTAGRATIAARYSIDRVAVDFARIYASEEGCHAMASTPRG